MPGTKTNERPGTRAVLRHYRMSATKARQVLDMVRGLEVDRAHELLRTTPREGARVVVKVLDSAVANARNNDGLDPDELYVSACYADDGTTVKRWRPRARGRATRIRKRTCHITVIVSRLPDDRLQRRRARQAESTAATRARRVAASRRERRALAEEEVVDEVTEAPEERLDEVDDELLDDELLEEEDVEDVEDEDAGGDGAEAAVVEDEDVEDEGAEAEGEAAEAATEEGD